MPPFSYLLSHLYPVLRLIWYFYPCPPCLWNSLIHVSIDEGDAFIYRSDLENPVYPEIPLRPLMGVLK